MTRSTSTWLSASHHRLLALLMFVCALCAGAIIGCGDDDPVKVPSVDGGTLSDSGKTDGGVIPTDGGVVDGAAEASTDGAVTDAETDASDGGDAGLPSLSIDNVTVAEGSSGTTSFTFTVTLSAASTGTVTVDYATADGTASSSTGAVGGADFSAATGTLTFNPGDTSKTVTVTVNGDATNEADETFTVTLANAANATLGTATGTGTITNDDAVPTISIADALVTEGNSGTTPATFAVTLSAASGQAVTVTYKTTDGTASSASDYAAIPDTVLTFAAGETTKNVVVNVNGDTTIEANETFTVDLSAPGNATIADGTATGTIQNDDGAAQPNITVDDPSISEGNAGTKVLNFTLSLSAAAASVVTVDFATANGTATVAGNDYQATAGTETFALGETQKTVSVNIVGDTANENNETFTLNLTNAQNALIAKPQGTATITNDDAVPTLTIGNASVAEGQAGTSNLTFTVTLSAASGKTVSANYATADGTATSGGSAAAGGQDYTATNSTVTFAPGTTSQQVTIPVAGDTLNEANETLTVTLTNPSNATLGATATGTGTINNDDALPLIVITDAAEVEGNTGTTDLVFTVSLINASSNPAPSGRTVTVNYTTSNGTAVAGSDYTAASNTVTFNPGVTQQTITIQANGDTTAEANETFNVALSGATNATISDAAAVGTIQNDDGSLPLLNVSDESIAEGNAGQSVMTFTVTLSAGSSQNVTVDYTTVAGTAVTAGVLANGGADFVAASDTLTFLPGEVSKTVAVTINGDVANEANETFTLVLSNPSTTAAISDGTGEGTITNDDAVPTLSIADASITEGNAGTSNMNFTVTLSAVSGRTVNVSYATADGTAKRTGLVVAGGTDYAAQTNTLTFLPGETTKNIAIAITGDTTLEGDDNFTVTLATPVNADLADATGVGTINNDDAAPTLSITNRTLAEGTPAPNTSDATAFTFTVTLSNANSASVSVQYATADGTATTAGDDYFASSGTLIFLPGETSKVVTVLVQKDAAAEANETFFVNLSAPTNATINDGQGLGTINNDD